MYGALNDGLGVGLGQKRAVRTATATCSSSPAETSLRKVVAPPVEDARPRPVGEGVRCWGRLVGDGEQMGGASIRTQ